MARILGGGVFGELRGKLGSLVFARNRGGAYARSYTIPVDPATIAQINARSNFGVASSNYHALNDGNKALWSNFAATVYNPKNGTIGVSSGFNAFVGMLTVVNNSRAFDSSDFLAPTALVGTNLPMEISEIPPTNALQANFANAGGGSNPYVLSSIGDLTATPGEEDILYSGVATIDITGGGIGTSGNLSEFVDAVGNKFGFSLFMSNPVAQPNLFIANPEKIYLGTKLGLDITAPASMPAEINLEFSTYLASERYRNLPSIGQFVRLTLYATATTGMMLKIGSQMVEITAP